MAGRAAEVVGLIDARQWAEAHDAREALRGWVGGLGWVGCNGWVGGRVGLGGV